MGGAWAQEQVPLGGSDFQVYQSEYLFTGFSSSTLWCSHILRCNGGMSGETGAQEEAAEMFV